MSRHPSPSPLFTAAHTTRAPGEDHNLGLSHDLARLEAGRLQRRQALAWFAAVAGSASSLGLVACGGGGGSDGSSASSSSGSGSSGGSTGSGSNNSACPLIPEETAGPYPGDGSNSANGSIANALALSGIVRRDIRSSIAGASGLAGGVPLTLTLRLQNSNSSSCADLSGYAVYLWHCDREGRYSMYSSGVTDQNYLRGVQSSGSDGLVVFDTIFPGCYDGRMPHMHFEVYRSQALASDYANKLRTSQIAFPEAICQQVYSSATGYNASSSNFARISFATDNVFSDGVSSQLASVSGSLSQGYAATVNVGVGA
ncbi:peptidase associated/transthyretin-like domain-containing protein [Kinneretia aquatilis]|uniref:intradiol ring-cleavage dioxygenase n=1 Tax=Kinneretia aquatilis TaxID=2070761 RepID=UPI001CBD0521|nr:intradiol ring-cleavage dioxygenase [Paucibacter aquatile]WIV96056.1 intradiol ring-cleavage dioxygenase [Paucibacter aquatile]